MRQAISRHADDALELIKLRRPVDGERIARAVLIRLVQFGEGAPHTRRQVAVDSLIEGSANPAAFREVFDILKAPEQRIITVDARPVTGDGSTTYVDVADLSHDAIIGGWPKLSGWVTSTIAWNRSAAAGRNAPLAAC